MAWRTATILRARYGSGKNCTVAMAQTLRNHDRSLLELPLEVSGSGNTAVGSWTNVGTFYLYAPSSFYGNVTLNILPTVDGNGDIRLYDDATVTGGPTHSFNVGSPTEAAATITLPSTTSWANLAVATAGGRLYRIQMQATAGTVAYDMDDRIAAWWSET